MSDKAAKSIGMAIAFAALCACATYLEVHDKSASGLWVLIVIWVLAVIL